MILFLDFDGVLHPEPFERMFCHLERFEAVMRDFPAVEIVISSMWRYQFGLEALRARFSKDIVARIIDTTLLPEHSGADTLTREREILNWLIAHRRMDESWLAVDDADWEFQWHRDQLIACASHVGFDDKAAEALRGKMETTLTR
ncbi:hypothetical protein F6R98_06540 [Candidatus Methylospira mobilis]|uniref:HAD family hydrolase n=1 Tax=Candidatus Methylospira mobilis TaxID=1808979 RepID=A0A5Q0BKN3_9GAMM|nr:HAD domain-containing protein [Candidatus Methylospira mobilis]QFY42326.1 hypothetical protein F6R98_06540 [Candidatus Methylospira mobilis]